MIYHLIGAGHIAERFIKKNSDKLCKVYDNNQNLHGTLLLGKKVYPVQNLTDEIEGTILICTTSIREIESQLTELSISMDVKIPPELEEFDKQSKILDKKGQYLIASGLPSNNFHNVKGGLFLIEESDQEVMVNTILSGPCHSVVRYGENYFVSHQEEGIIKLDQDFNILEKITLPQGCRPHGLMLNDTHFYVVASNFDAVIEVNRKDESTKILKLSNKFEKFKSPQHHANDIEVIGEYAYVSMFSTSGNWKRGIYDGGLIEIDLSNGKTRELSFDLKLPHSVRSVDGSLIILNSFLGEFEGFKKFPKLRFNGFLRGFDHDEDYFYLAESRNRNSTGLIRESLPSSINSNLIIVDRISNYSRTIPLPHNISEIHSVLSI
jgi:hypothetical protein